MLMGWLCIEALVCRSVFNLMLLDSTPMIICRNGDRKSYPIDLELIAIAQL